eukprot:3936001-Rhodomonas_salina.1
MSELPSATSCSPIQPPCMSTLEGKKLERKTRTDKNRKRNERAYLNSGGEAGKVAGEVRVAVALHRRATPCPRPPQRVPAATRSRLREC